MLSLPLALDAMGGDNAPGSVIGGAHLAHLRYPDLRFIFFGRESDINPLLAVHPSLAAKSEVVHTESSIAAGDKPSVALRQGKQSSMRLAIDAVHEGRACGAISAGNTGALMAISKVVLRTLPGIDRPAIVALVPTMRGDCVMLDLGANVECDANHLFQFAIMGDSFARAVLGLPRPRVALLNIGSEEMKGHDELKNAYGMLKNCGDVIDFHGFVEGNDIAEGMVDVVVTDGFSGNIALKTAEGTATLIRHYLRGVFSSSLTNRLGYFIARPALDALKDHLDPRKHNGAMFVGLNGIIVKSHGGADAFSFSNAIHVAIELAEHQVNKHITDELSSTHASAQSLSEAAEI